MFDPYAHLAHLVIRLVSGGCGTCGGDQVRAHDPRYPDLIMTAIAHTDTCPNQPKETACPDTIATPPTSSRR